ncbi:MAG: CopG family transcriptional regulator [Desulfuromonas sp. SDB]|nr:MAG: CopG family transcriptional regulator [Desulfuromonas sp. SDB]
MKTKTKYSKGPIGKVKDFLPSPEELTFKDETVKITISLSKASVEFFKKEAQQHQTQYQKMIRRLLDEYVAHQ